MGSNLAAGAVDADDDGHWPPVERYPPSTPPATQSAGTACSAARASARLQWKMDVSVHCRRRPWASTTPLPLPQASTVTHAATDTVAQPPKLRPGAHHSASSQACCGRGQSAPSGKGGGSFAACLSFAGSSAHRHLPNPTKAAARRPRSLSSSLPTSLPLPLSPYLYLLLLLHPPPPLNLLAIFAIHHPHCRQRTTILKSLFLASCPAPDDHSSTGPPDFGFSFVLLSPDTRPPSLIPHTQICAAPPTTTIPTKAASLPNHNTQRWRPPGPKRRIRTCLHTTTTTRNLRTRRPCHTTTTAADIAARPGCLSRRTPTGSSAACAA